MARPTRPIDTLCQYFPKDTTDNYTIIARKCINKISVPLKLTTGEALQTRV